MHKTTKLGLIFMYHSVLPCVHRDLHLFQTPTVCNTLYQP